MFPQSVWMDELMQSHDHTGHLFDFCKVTLVASVWNYTGFTGLTFLHCAFWNVSSKCQPGLMHCHSGRTVCTFSNVSSNWLPLRVQSNIANNCPSDNLVAFIQFFPMFEITQVALDFDFFHSAFSNVSSNWLPLRMQSHIGCIYSTFPHVWKLLTWWICGIFLSRESINKSEDSHDTSLKANAENSCKQIGIL